MVCADGLPDLEGRYLVETFLEPLPKWLTESPYFGDLGLEMMRQYVGDLLLRIVLPIEYAGLYVADYAHVLECKHLKHRGHPALDLGYDCATGREMCRADALSYVRLDEYRGGHVAPIAKITRIGTGIAVPPQHISVCEVQPLHIGS